MHLNSTDYVKLFLGLINDKKEVQLISSLQGYKPQCKEAHDTFHQGLGHNQ